MDKALEMGKTSAAGSFHLLIGVAGSTIIMAIGTLVLTGLLPVAQVGLYGMALIPSSIINYFRDWGINSALTQRIASLKSQGRESEIHDVMLSGIVFELVSGILLSLICFALAEPLAYILSPSDASNLTIYISIMSLSIFAGAITAAASGIFVGYERMKLNSFTQILTAIVKTAFGPALIIVGFGVLGAIYAAVVSVVVGGVVAILLVYFAFYRQLRKCTTTRCNIRQTLKPMLSYGLPLTVSATIVGVLPQVFAFMTAIYAGTWMMGNYYAASYFAVLLSFIYIPVSTALFPIFSRLDPKKEPELLQTVFATSVKYTALLLVPATLVIMTLSAPLVNTLFPQAGIFHSLFIPDAAPKFPYAPLFLSLSSVVYLLILFGNYTMGTFQNGIGKTHQAMKQSVVSLAVSLPVTYLLIIYLNKIGGPSYAVIGGIAGVIIASVPNAVWGLYWSWKNYKVKADFKISAKILISAAVAAAVTYVFISVVHLPNWVTLVTGFVLYLAIYLSCAPLIGAVNHYDIENFKAMFANVGFVSKFLAFPLFFMSKLCKPSEAEKVLQTQQPNNPTAQ